MDLFDTTTQRHIKRWTLLIGSALLVGFLLGRVSAALL
jgi:hypothetical protein